MEQQPATSCSLLPCAHSLKLLHLGPVPPISHVPQHPTQVLRSPSRLEREGGTKSSQLPTSTTSSMRPLRSTPSQPPGNQSERLGRRSLRRPRQQGSAWVAMQPHARTVSHHCWHGVR